MEQALDKTLRDFMGVTAKSTAAVIVPLFGFWGDVQNNPVNGEVLKLALSRLYSNVHHLYIIFVAHPESLPQDVVNVILGKAKMGNTTNLPVSRNATYPEYIAEGMEFAINETNAQFMLVFNPWVMVQDSGLDVLIDRCNRADDAKVVSGYDLRSVIEPENFDNYNNSIPSEERDLSLNLLAMPRYIAEMVTVDQEYHTHAFLERDLWQQIMRKSFVPITSQRVPTFPFDFPWEDYEPKQEFEADRQYFIRKWTFDPGIQYHDTRGAGRRDKTGAR